MTISILILALVTAERVGELVLAGRNTRRLLARGGVEAGADHYPIIVGLHAAWLAGLWLLARDRPVEFGWLGAFLVLQGFRAWTLLTLRGRWTTRVISVPGEALVQAGPYRFVRHPNYLVVVGEILVLPLAFGLVAYAAVFTAMNASVLWLRIRVEERALSA